MAIFPSATNFRESVANIAPPRLRGKWGERFLYMIAVQLDAIADALREGVKLRMPGVGSPEALPYLGRDRVIMRGFAESDENYAGRLTRAFDDWAIAGSPVAVILQLLGYVSPVVPRIRYVVNGKLRSSGDFVATWVTIEAGSVTIHRADPNNWNWDGDFTKLARFWVIVYPGVWASKTWGDGHFYDDGTTWGSVATADTVNDVRRIISTFKAAGSLCQYVIVAANDADFDPAGAPGAPLPAGDWNRPYKIVAGDATPTRIPALYWKGTV